jgi:hypothetical protein
MDNNDCHAKVQGWRPKKHEGSAHFSGLGRLVDKSPSQGSILANKTRQAELEAQQ